MKFSVLSRKLTQKRRLHEQLQCSECGSLEEHHRRKQYLQSNKIVFMQTCLHVSHLQWLHAVVLQPVLGLMSFPQHALHESAISSNKMLLVQKHKIQVLDKPNASSMAAPLLIALVARPAFG